MAGVSVPDSVSMPPPPPPRPIPRMSNSTSPPPNCAICLGSCTNKSFSDSCMHQFCFTCLLEWSKIKPECPLCKQPFTTIIHNVKSNNEYDEHFVEPNRQQQEVPNQINDLLFLPSGQPPSRHFQFRTTFTVDPRGEFAIQQMLLSHPLTNSVSYIPHYIPERYRRLISSTNFRRFIYDENLWVSRTVDVTGRFREASPRYFREHPGAINRLAPWLNRELNALLSGNTQQIMTLIDTIMQHLHRHHINGFFFKNLLSPYLGPRTEHFIHEFYSFMRSPYDMVGYDRHSCYTSFPQPALSDENTSGTDDSDDIAIVATTSAAPTVSTAAVNPFHRPTIEVIEINSDTSNDSDVIIQEPTPVIVDLLNSSDDDDVLPVFPETEANKQASQPSSSNSKISIIDVKIKKRKRKLKMKDLKRREKKRGKGIYTSSSSNSSSSSVDSEGTRRRKKRYIKKMKRYYRSSSSSSTSSTSSSSSSTSTTSTSSSSTNDSEKFKRIKEKSKARNKSKKYLKSQRSNTTVTSTATPSTSKELKKEYCEATTNTDYWATEPQTSTQNTSTEIAPLDYSMANFARSYNGNDHPRYDGPSCSTKVEPLHIKREYNLWFRPSYDRNDPDYKYGSDDTDCDD